MAAGQGNLDISIRINADGSQAIVNLRRTEDATRNLGDQARASGRELEGFGNAIKGMVAAAAGFVALDTMVSGFMEANVEAGRLRASLETVTGSVRGASDAWDELTQFAARTPFDLAQSVEGFIKLKALGLDPSIEALESYGNTASSMGKSMTDMIEAVADATVGEFERLKEFGIKASSEGDRVALTFQGITTTIANDAKSIEGYLQQIGNVQFAGAMERQAETLGGALSNLEDSISSFWVAIGDLGAADAATEAIADLAVVIGDVTTAIAQGEFDAWITGLQGVAGAAAAVSAAYLTMAAAVNAAKIAVAAFNLIVKANAFVVLATAAVAAAGAIAATKDSLIEFGGETGTVGDLVKAVGVVLKETFGPSLKAVFDQVADWIAGLGIDFALLWESIKVGAATAANGWINTFVALWRSLGAIAAAIVVAFRNAFSDIAAIAGSAMADLTNLDFSFTGTRAAIVAAGQAQLANVQQITDEVKANFDASNDYVGGVMTRAKEFTGQIAAEFKDISLERQLDEAIASEAALSDASGTLADAQKRAADASAQHTTALGSQAESADKLTKAQRSAAASMAEYAERAGNVLGLNERQNATLLEILPAIDAAADKYGLMREVIVGLIAQESGFDRAGQVERGRHGPDADHAGHRSGHRTPDRRVCRRSILISTPTSRPAPTT
jgi:hypothetical protein